jgi:hypothetical protein
MASSHTPTQLGITESHRASGANRGRTESILLPLKKRNPQYIRAWPHKKKVSSNLSREFPWEIILGHLKKDTQGIHALVMLQMVDKNLNQTITSNLPLWTELFKKYIYRSYFNTSLRCMNDFRFQRLLLRTSINYPVPIHTGLIPGDPSYADQPDRNKEFSDYVRKAVALKIGKHCGLCGARHRHVPYWGLGMRVCSLCFAHNSISALSLYHDYGLHFMDIIRNHYEDIFYYEMSCNETDCRITFWNTNGMHKECSNNALNSKGSHHMIWRPHLEKVMDLVKIKQDHKVRKEASQTLCSAIKRHWILLQRKKAASRSKRPSIDAFLINLNQNETKRLIHPYGRPMETCIVLGMLYAFSWPSSNRIEKVHKVRSEWVYGKFSEWMMRVPKLISA